jgi:16S rRNA processing protein RimM
MTLIEIGRIIRPHGLTGRLKVLSYLESTAALDGIAAVFVGKKVEEIVSYPLQAIQAGRGSFVLKLEGVEDRDDASRLAGSSLWLSREVLKELPEGEYYWQDIIGLRVVTEEGLFLGRIESVFATGSNDVYVCRMGKKEILLPGISDVVRRIDPRSGVMVVRLLEGLAG